MIHIAKIPKFSLAPWDCIRLFLLLFEFLFYCGMDICRFWNTWEHQFMFIMNLIISIRIIAGSYNIIHLVSWSFYLFFSIGSWPLYLLDGNNVFYWSCWKKKLSMMNRYVKSRSDKQLRFGAKYTSESCSPVQWDNNGSPIVPCGLIAWSLFNDTYDFTHGSKEIKVNRKNISWKSDREHKFGKDVFPSNFQNGTLIGGGKLDPTVPVSTLIN